MIDEFAHMLSLSSFALIVIVLMCLICGFIIAQLQDSIPGIILGYIGLFGVALAANVVVRRLGVHFVANKDVDAIIATTLGLILSVVGYTAIKLTLTLIYGTTRRIPTTDEDAVRSVSNG